MLNDALLFSLLIVLKRRCSVERLRVLSVCCPFPFLIVGKLQTYTFAISWFVELTLPK